MQGTVDGKADNSAVTNLSNLIAAVKTVSDTNQKGVDSLKIEIQQAKKDITTLQNTKPDLSGYVTKDEFNAAYHGVEISEADYNKLPSEQKNKQHIVYIVH